MDETLELLIEAHKIIKSHAKAGGPYEEWLTKAGKTLRLKPAAKTAVAAADLAYEAMDSTPLRFGRHKGKTPLELLTIDPSYLVWLDGELKPRRVSQVLATHARMKMYRGAAV
jgi:hypothetical protein